MNVNIIDVYVRRQCHSRVCGSVTRTPFAVVWREIRVTNEKTAPAVSRGSRKDRSLENEVARVHLIAKIDCDIDGHVGHGVTAIVDIDQ